MCLFISIEARREQRDALTSAAALASRDGVRVDVEHPSRWPWAQQRPVLAKLTEDGGCSCSLLADDADWNAAAWALRPDVLPAVLAAFHALLMQGPSGLRISALWAGDQPASVEHVTPGDFLALVANQQLGTKTAYVIRPAA